MSEPFIAIGADEFGGNLSDTIQCPHCGQRHAIEQSGPSRSYDPDTNTWTEGPAGLLQFYQCGESTYLAGIRGKGLK